MINALKMGLLLLIFTPIVITIITMIILATVITSVF